MGTSIYIVFSTERPAACWARSNANASFLAHEGLTSAPGAIERFLVYQKAWLKSGVDREFTDITEVRVESDIAPSSMGVLVALDDRINPHHPICGRAKSLRRIATTNALPIDHHIVADEGRTNLLKLALQNRAVSENGWLDTYSLHSQIVYKHLPLILKVRRQPHYGKHTADIS
jgi:hypothetical protein